MRVLLTEPPGAAKGWEYSISSRENLGLGYLTAVLRSDGHTVEEISCPALGLSGNDLLARAKDFRPALIGVSLPFTDELEAALVSVGRFCHEFPSVPVVVGGHAATAAAAAILRDFPQVTAVVRGEGELTLLELTRCLESGTDVSCVAGLALRGRDGALFTPERGLVADLDSLPFPTRDTLKAKRARGAMPEEVYVTSSRGCPYRCSFCDIKSFYKSGKGLAWRGRSPANVVKELGELRREFGPDCVYCFVDDQFIGPGRMGQERAKAVADEIIGSGLEIRFEITCRADTMQRETLIRLKEAGLSGVYLGLDSGSQAALDRFQKDTTVERNIEAVKLLRQLDIPVDFGFIMFDPWTTVDDLRENIRFLKKVAELGVPIHTSVLTNSLKLYPNTPIAEKVAGKFRSEFRASENGSRSSMTPTAREVETTIRNLLGENSSPVLSPAFFEIIERSIVFSSRL